MDFIFLSAAGSLIQLTIQCLCCNSGNQKVFIELAGAGAMGKELAIFQRLNIGNKNMNSIFRCQNKAC